MIMMILISIITMILVKIVMTMVVAWGAGWQICNYQFHHNGGWRSWWAMWEQFALSNWPFQLCEHGNVGVRIYNNKRRKHPPFVWFVLSQNLTSQCIFIVFVFVFVFPRLGVQRKGKEVRTVCGSFEWLRRWRGRIGKVEREFWGRKSWTDKRIELGEESNGTENWSAENWRDTDEGRREGGVVEGKLCRKGGIVSAQFSGSALRALGQYLEGEY